MTIQPCVNVEGQLEYRHHCLISAQLQRAKLSFRGWEDSDCKELKPGGVSARYRSAWFAAIRCRVLLTTKRC